MSLIKNTECSQFLLDKTVDHISDVQCNTNHLNFMNLLATGPEQPGLRRDEENERRKARGEEDRGAQSGG